MLAPPYHSLSLNPEKRTDFSLLPSIILFYFVSFFSHNGCIKDAAYCEFNYSNLKACAKN